MNFLTLCIAAVLGLTTLTTGCAVIRDQESAGAYIDDASITAAVKAKFVSEKNVDASAISVETMKGTVQLSGFAKSTLEKDRAAQIARETKGVMAVRNDILVRP